VGSGQAWALHCGLGLLRAWPGGWAWGLDCGLSPKTRPARAWAFELCSKSLSPSLSPVPHVGLGPGPNTALVNLKDLDFAVTLFLLKLAVSCQNAT
jgi:hypothetical protein